MMQAGGWVREEIGSEPRTLHPFKPQVSAEMHIAHMFLPDKEDDEKKNEKKKKEKKKKKERLRGKDLGVRGRDIDTGLKLEHRTAVNHTHRHPL